MVSLEYLTFLTMPPRKKKAEITAVVDAGHYSNIFIKDMVNGNATKEPSISSHLTPLHQSLSCTNATKHASLISTHFPASIGPQNRDDYHFKLRRNKGWPWGLHHI